ncbi:DUF1015 family protein [Alkalibaculum sp. M08DMB]|uniref:DUF1015 family protein n=1 Tax=Alkalibaculum sporogenes TaxID=2655001 RepID=A0A6A7KC63_9FIRM|nr:DUF1015 family protein [Alkalibaculum sporogenes]MPW27108.1 DUF1015 family protein [Alkalibaculum sporogenes]
MAIIKDFWGIRPHKEHVHKVAALPYDVYSSSEARKVVEGNPYSFLHIDRAEIDLPESVDIYSDQVYQKANSNLSSMVDKGIFIQDDSKSMYIYRLTMGDRSQTGLVCCSAIDDYLSGVIKKHELTRADKELDRIKHVDVCDANTGPIFLTYKGQDKINEIISTWIDNNELEYSFISDDGIKHEVWTVNDTSTIIDLKKLFSNIENTYIADGHHRTASAVKVGLNRRESNPNYTGKEEFNYFLSVLFPHDQLYIMDYNRVVKDLNGLSKEVFLEQISKIFIIKTSESQVKPTKKGMLGMYLDQQWYQLEVKSEMISNDTVKNLDVSILQENVLTPILGIEDIRTDNRIDFVGGIRGLDELEKRCTQDMVLAFAMYPTSIEELMKISDEDKLMPPKSTWFEPKLRSGLFIHKLT